MVGIQAAGIGGALIGMAAMLSTKFCGPENMIMILSCSLYGISWIACKDKHRCIRVLRELQIDSLLGATLQLSLVDTKSDKIIEGFGGAVVPPSRDRKVVSGRNVLTNNSVCNLKFAALYNDVIGKLSNDDNYIPFLPCFCIDI